MSRCKVGAISKPSSVCFITVEPGSYGCQRDSQKVLYHPDNCVKQALRIILHKRKRFG